jgi:cytochrome c oxidase subunit IV|tara:strand:- start:2212 stop:2469 length:258 start_codon:yes stop_codon:yes gene_type:complete
MSASNKTQEIKTGWIVILFLFVLTIIEFFVALYIHGTLQLILFLVIGLFKGGLIMSLFMHFNQLSKNISDLWQGIIFTYKNEGGN